MRWESCGEGWERGKKEQEELLCVGFGFEIDACGGDFDAGAGQNCVMCEVVSCQLGVVLFTIVWSDEFDLLGAVCDEDQCFWHVDTLFLVGWAGMQQSQKVSWQIVSCCCCCCLHATTSDDVAWLEHSVGKRTPRQGFEEGKEAGERGSPNERLVSDLRVSPQEAHKLFSTIGALVACLIVSAQGS